MATDGGRERDSTALSVALLQPCSFQERCDEQIQSSKQCYVLSIEQKQIVALNCEQLAAVGTASLGHLGVMHTLCLMTPTSGFDKSVTSTGSHHLPTRHGASFLVCFATMILPSLSLVKRAAFVQSRIRRRVCWSGANGRHASRQFRTLHRAHSILKDHSSPVPSALTYRTPIRKERCAVTGGCRSCVHLITMARLVVSWPRPRPRSPG